MEMKLRVDVVFSLFMLFDRKVYETILYLEHRALAQTGELVDPVKDSFHSVLHVYLFFGFPTFFVSRMEAGLVVTVRRYLPPRRSYE